MSATDDLVGAVAQRAAEAGLRVVTAESLTCGSLATRLGAGPDAASWFGGGIIAYQEPIKFDLLGVDPGPVVTQRCAEQMAHGARRLFHADVAVSTTGVGGPGPSEGKPAGTVFLSVVSEQVVRNQELHFEGSAEEILAQCSTAAVELLGGVIAAS